MLGSSESRVPKILSQISVKPNKMNSNVYLSRAKECFRNNRLPESFRNFVNYFDSLDDPSSSTPSVQLGFTKLVCRIGLIMEESDDPEELLKVYLQALNFFPNNYIILNNLGGYLFKIGEEDVARTYLEKAVACSKNYLPAEKNLMHCKWRQVERWHFKMLNDTNRNVAYYNAIRTAINQGFERMLEIGAGCGLLTLMASENPEVHVTAIEENKALAKMCESIMKENNRKNVVVINDNSTKFCDSPSPGPCNLIVTEIFDCALFGERMLSTLVHAHCCLIPSDTMYKIIPGGAKVYVTAINYKDHQSYRVVNPPADLNMSGMCIRQENAAPYDAEDLTTKDVEYLSDTLLLYDINFYNVEELHKLGNMPDFSVEFDLMFNKDSTFNALAVWFDLALDDDITITSNPHRPDRVKCWEHAIFHMAHPLEVKTGDSMTFESSILDNQLTIVPISETSSCTSCWMVSREIVSFLNDTALVDTIRNLETRFHNPEFLVTFPDPQLPLMDLSSFPLFGLMLAIKRGCQIFITAKAEEFLYKEFYQHILQLNQTEFSKVTVLENSLEPNTGLLSIRKRLGDCRACLLDPISCDGSLHPTLVLKEKIVPNIRDVLMLPSSVVVKLVLIYSEQLDTWNVIKDENVFNFKIGKFMNDYTGKEHPDLDSSFKYREYSSPVTFTVDDKDFVKKTQNILVTETGRINGIFSWYEIRFFGQTIFSTKNSVHIKRCCYILDPRSVELGDLFRIVMRREGTYIDFHLED